MRVVYVVMVKAPGNIIMTECVFADVHKAKRYVANRNRDSGSRFYYFEKNIFHE